MSSRSFAPLCSEANFAKRSREATPNHDQLQDLQRDASKVILPDKLHCSVPTTTRSSRLPHFIRSKSYYDLLLSHNGSKTLNCVNKQVEFSPPSHRSHVMRGSVTDPYRHAKRTGHVRAPAPSHQKQRRFYWWGCSKKTISHIGAFLCWAAALPCNMVISQNRAKDTRGQIINYIVSQCSSSKTTWVPFHIFSTQDQYFSFAKKSKVQSSRKRSKKMQGKPMGGEMAH